jgi:hypothetical protein
MRPTPTGLIFTFLVSAAFTALVAVDALGVVWLVLGPGAGATAEIVISNFGQRGPGRRVGAGDAGPHAPAGAVSEPGETI